MFCPRCGRTVNETANFCGGCGLPRAEIEKLLQNTAPVSQPEISTIDINDINSTISQLEGDLTVINSVENYTTDSTTNTDKVENDFETSDIVLEFDDITSQPKEPQPDVEHRYTPPVYPEYTKPVYTAVETKQPVAESDTVSTVDFVWMMLISGIPVIGFFYLLYMAFGQRDSAVKSSWAKATLSVYIFAVAVSLVFSLGMMMSTFMFW